MSNNADGGGILAKLLREIRINLHAMDPTTVHNQISRYIAKCGQMSGKKPLKANLTSYLASPNLTMKRFVEMMSLFGWTNFTITITIHHQNKKRTEHSIEVNIEDGFEDGTEGSEEEKE